MGRQRRRRGAKSGDRSSAWIGWTLAALALLAAVAVPIYVHNQDVRNQHVRDHFEHEPKMDPVPRGYHVSEGDSGRAVYLTGTQPFELEGGFIIRLDENGRPLVSLPIYDEHGVMLGQLRDSKLYVPVEHGVDINWDGDDLELVDGHKRPMLQLIRDDDDHRLLVHIFSFRKRERAGDTPLMFIAGKRGILDGWPEKVGRAAQAEVPRLFEYPGFQHLGQRHL